MDMNYFIEEFPGFLIIIIFYLLFVPFLDLAAPPVQTAGRGRAHLRRGTDSTCKLIFELCVGFLKLKFPNPHIFL